MAGDEDDSHGFPPSLQAVLAAAGRVGGGVAGVGVVSSCAHATDVLREQASRAGLRLLHVLQVDDESDITKRITHFINNNVVRVFLSITISACQNLNVFDTPALLHSVMAYGGTRSARNVFAETVKRSKVTF